MEGTVTIPLNTYLDLLKVQEIAEGKTPTLRILQSRYSDIGRLYCGDELTEKLVSIAKENEEKIVELELKIISLEAKPYKFKLW